MCEEWNQSAGRNAALENGSFTLKPFVCFMASVSLYKHAHGPSRSFKSIFVGVHPRLDTALPQTSCELRSLKYFDVFQRVNEKLKKF